MISRIEITENNTFQVREIIDDEGIKSFYRRTASSESDLTDGPQLLQDLAILFPFVAESKHAEGAHDDVSIIRISVNDLTAFAYQEIKHVVRDGETVASEKQQAQQVDALTKLAGLPAKVQAVSEYLFTPAVKKAFIASLPTEHVPQTKLAQVVHLEPVMIEVNGDAVQESTVKTRAVEASEAVQMVDGVAQLVTIPASTEKYLEPNFTEHLVFDANGDAVMEEVPALNKAGVQKTIEKVIYKGELHLKSAL